MKIILGSASPRRRELLSLLTSDFEVRVSDADESFDSHVTPFDVPKILAERKALAIPLCEDELVIASDTVVICKDKILGKPGSKENAVEMLRMLSDGIHYVVSGITVRTADKIYSEAVTSVVHMRHLTDTEINIYVEKWNPVDKAGAYGIQEMAGSFVSRIEGDFYNIVGLPLCRLTEILKDEFGVSLL